MPFSDQSAHDISWTSQDIADWRLGIAGVLKVGLDHIASLSGRAYRGSEQDRAETVRLINELTELLRKLPEYLSGLDAGGKDRMIRFDPETLREEIADLGFGNPRCRFLREQLMDCLPGGIYSLASELNAGVED